MLTTTLNYSHWYGPGLMGAIVSTTAPTQDLTVKAEVACDLANTVDPAESVDVRKGNKVSVTGTVTPDDDLTVRANVGVDIVSKVNELNQDDIIGAVLTTQIEPGLTFADALKEARKAAKLAAALSA